MSQNAAQSYVQLTRTSKQAALSRVIWSVTDSSRNRGIFLANSTTLTMPSELSSSTLSHPGRADGDATPLPPAGLLTAESESRVVVSGLGRLSDSSPPQPPVLLEPVLGTGEATEGLGDAPNTFYNKQRRNIPSGLCM